VLVVIRDLSNGDEASIAAIGHLFDGDAQANATRRFLGDAGHHLLVAYEDDEAVGFVTGVEMTHPDKGTEMFLYELGVAEQFRRRGIGTALVHGLAEAARASGCYGMWVLTEDDDEPAQRTYAAAGAVDRQAQTMLSWRFPRT
jgi:ribosomal protein S18 acetylase RimI-like enzyme